MDTSNFFVPLAYKCPITRPLLDFARSVPDEVWEDKLGFLITFVPDEIIDLDPYLRAIKAHYEVLAVLLCLPPNTCYPWHTDATRRTALNMQLNAYDQSCCVFTKGRSDEQYFEIAQLKYQPDTYYVFNTQEEHMVMNFSEKRYMFSFTLKGVRDVPFRQVADRLLAIQTKVLQADTADTAA